MKQWMVLAALLASTSFAAGAGEWPRSSQIDPRIRLVAYSPDIVIQITGFLGYQQMIEFAADERIENVAIGDATAWQVTPNKRGNILFLKPLERSARTNMTVVTDRRRYNFELTAKSGTLALQHDLTFAIRFKYPDVIAAAPPPETKKPADPDPSLAPEKWNLAYSYDGAKINVPARLFDDGKATYFQWPEGVATPAILLVADDKSESIVNFRQGGKYIIVEQISRQFILRNGKDITRLYNDGFNEPDLGPAAPKPRTQKKKRRGLFGLFASKDTE